MALEALEKIRQAESDAMAIIDRAKLEAERIASEATAKAVSDIEQTKRNLELDKEQVLTAARQLAEDKAKTIKDSAILEINFIKENLEQKKDNAKKAVYEEISR